MGSNQTTSDGLIRHCPECGSGDVRWCTISVRPYCNDCDTWGPINYGSAMDAIMPWNSRVIAATERETNDAPE
jgi:uncharacterized protein (DUF983 family)